MSARDWGLGLRIAPASPASIALTATAGCATPPEVKRDYLYEAAWRGSALTVVGRQMVVDAAAGAAPQTVTLIDVNARAEVAGDARAARANSGPAGRNRADGTAPQRNCARRYRRVGRRWPGRRPDVSSRRIADKTHGPHRPLLTSGMRWPLDAGRGGVVIRARKQPVCLGRGPDARRRRRCASSGKSREPDRQ